MVIGVIMMLRSVIILGAGSAGLLAAITLKKKVPQLDVRVVRSSDIGVIGVGEGTTPAMPHHLFGLLGINQAMFYKHAEPTWKLGVRFLWGPRDHFDYTFDRQLDGQWSQSSRSKGFYADEEFRGISLAAALMEAGRAFPRNLRAGGVPEMSVAYGFHIENVKLVETLEMIATAAGVTFIEGKMSGAERGPKGIAALLLEDGRRLEAELFVDCSGFRSELIGRTMGEEFEDYRRALFCDRAVIGGWERTTEPILPYTIAETMEAGWAWRIDHEHHINRGYVYCSQAISDEAACEEFLRKNPKAPKEPRVVKFRSGHHRRVWVDNVVAIGNSAGFVEPLEATALWVVCEQCASLAAMLFDSGLCPTDTMRDFYNKQISGTFDYTRDFLSLHYKLNTRLDNEFWRHCRADTDLGALAPMLEFYTENGPTVLNRLAVPMPERNTFGVDGHLAMLVGNRAPYKARYQPTDAERALFNKMRADLAAHAAQGVSVKEMLGVIRSPQWKWGS